MRSLSCDTQGGKRQSRGLFEMQSRVRRYLCTLNNPQSWGSGNEPLLPLRLLTWNTAVDANRMKKSSNWIKCPSKQRMYQYVAIRTQDQLWRTDITILSNSVVALLFKSPITLSTCSHSCCFIFSEQKPLLLHSRTKETLYIIEKLWVSSSLFTWFTSTLILFPRCSHSSG